MALPKWLHHDGFTIASLLIPVDPRKAATIAALGWRFTPPPARLRGRLGAFDAAVVGDPAQQETQHGMTIC